MEGITRTAYDRQVYEQELADFLPDRLIDAHTHVWEEGTLRSGEEENRACVRWPLMVASSCTIRDLLLSYEQMFPGKAVRPLLMGYPTAILDKTNAYALDCARRCSLPVLYCTRYDTPPETLREALAQGYCGIKPYQNNSPSYIPEREIRISDFLPREHLEVMEECGGVVMLHISRPARLRDPLNLAQLMEIEERYPHIRLIVAHIGRAYAPEDLGDAFEILGRSKNMAFDFSANTLDEAMAACIRAVGPERLLFGSDMPITKMRMYRVTENGVYYNVVPRGLYGDVSEDPHMRETEDADRMTLFMYEELRAFKRCAQRLGLSRENIRDIFYGNAARVLGI
mgnify:CR=1 FL=1